MTPHEQVVGSKCVQPPGFSLVENVNVMQSNSFHHHTCKAIQLGGIPDVATAAATVAGATIVAACKLTVEPATRLQSQYDSTHDELSRRHGVLVSKVHVLDGQLPVPPAPTG